MYLSFSALVRVPTLFKIEIQPLILVDARPKNLPENTGIGS